MKLDLRPKKLIVKFGATDPEKIHNVKEWFSVRCIHHQIKQCLHSMIDIICLSYRLPDKLTIYLPGQVVVI